MWENLSMDQKKRGGIFCFTTTMFFGLIFFGAMFLLIIHYTVVDPPQVEGANGEPPAEPNP
jgi:hypothetical protein